MRHCLCVPRRFTPIQDEQIRVAYEAGDTIYVLAARLICSTAAVCNALDRTGTRRRLLSEACAKTSTAEAAALRAEYEAGSSVSQLVSRHGLGRDAVRRAILRSGGAMRSQGSRPREWDAQQLASIAALRREGLTLAEVASREGLSEPMVRDALRVAGVPPAPRGRRRIGRRRDAHGYVSVLLDPDDPFVGMARAAGYVMEHRLVMARALGRPLERTEQVHHINGDRADNRLENLQLRHGPHGAGRVLHCGDCGSANLVAVELV